MRKLILILAAVLFFEGNGGGPALAQKKPLTGNLIQDIRQRADSSDNVGGGSGGGSGLESLLDAFDAKLEPDLKIALYIANKNENQMTAKCWQAWLDQIDKRRIAGKDEQGNDLALPDPHLITSLERIIDMRNALQPTAPFFQACQPIAAMVRMDITRLIGAVIGGGAGLLRLVPGL